MKKNIARELKNLDIEIGRKMFDISKESKMSGPPSPLQAGILDYLIMNKEKQINQKQLEENLGVSKTTISNALLSMEKNEMIERIQSDTDARNKEIRLTKKSENIFKEMINMFEILNKEMLKGISENEIEMFYCIIEKIKNNIRREN